LTQRSSNSQSAISLDDGRAENYSALFEPTKTSNPWPAGQGFSFARLLKPSFLYLASLEDRVEESVSEKTRPEEEMLKGTPDVLILLSIPAAWLDCFLRIEWCGAS